MIKIKLFLESILRSLYRIFNQKYDLAFIQKRILFVRKDNPTDKEVLSYVFNDLYHRPFKIVKKINPIFLDLGSNIGFTIIDLKKEYPSASIIGCEMDKDNYMLSLKNCSRLKNVIILNNAIWYENVVVSYNNSVNSDAFAIKTNLPCNESASIVSIDSITINSIIQKYSITELDYVKMDIEGAELEVILNNNKWLEIVCQIKIEYHTGEEDAKRIKELLTSKGFTVLKDSHHWSTIIAYKN